MESLTWPDNLWADILDTPWPPWQEPGGEGEQKPVLYLQNLESVIADAMKERYQKALHLRYEQEMTYREVGEAIGANPEGTRQIIVKALRILREPKNFYRLSAVPEIEVVRQRKEINELTRQNEELKQRISELFGQMEREKAEKRLQVPLDSSLDALSLSTRSHNALVAKGILTVGQLINCSIADLKQLGRLGKTSIENIVAALAEHGFELKKE